MYISPTQLQFKVLKTQILYGARTTPPKVPLGTYKLFCIMASPMQASHFKKALAMASVNLAASLLFKSFLTGFHLYGGGREGIAFPVEGIVTPKGSMRG